MKKICLLLLLSVLGFGVSAQHLYQPSGTSTFTGAASYCKDATPIPLVFTFNTCNSGIGVPSGVVSSITWYYNTFNSTSLVSATVVSGPSSFLCPTSVTGTQSIAPPTGVVGPFYYFCVISWTGGTAGCPGGPAGSITSSTTQLVTITAPLPPITPGVTGISDSVCLGSTLALSNATPTGAWSSSSNPTASVGASSGVVTGMAPGVAVISYSLGGCITTRFVEVRDTPAAITPTVPPVLCVGASTTLSDISPGGTWLSSPSGIASVVTTSGFVTGVSPGTALITYQFSVSQCYTTRMVSINPNPSPITGTTGVCVAGNSTLSDLTLLGTWSSSNGLIAPVGITSGVVSGSAAGTATITFTSSNGCIATTTVTVSAAPAPIIGAASTVCSGGATFTLTDPSPGGTWSSGATGTATVSPTGVVTGILPGSTIIYYTITGCPPAMRPITVNPLPGLITGILSACNGLTTSLFNVTPGGHWFSNDTSIASIDTFSGIATGHVMGTTTITYSISSGCSVYATLTVNPLAPILGSDTICVGSTTALTDIVGGGTWASSNPAIGTIGSSSGIVTGLVDGITFIVYTLPTTCSTSFFLRVLPPPPSIAGLKKICSGATTTLSDVYVGGTWSTSNAFVAGINSATGAMTGHFPDTANITYSVYGCQVKTQVTIDPLPNPVLTFNSSTQALSTFNFYASYQWFDSSHGALPGATNSIYVLPGGSEFYRVVVTDANGCMNSSVFKNPLVVTDLDISAIKVYPNPATTSVFVASPVLLNAVITSIDGKVMMTQENVKEVNVGSLSPGIYLMSLSDVTGQVITVKKLLKE